MTKSRLFNFYALTVCTQNPFAIISRDRKGTIVAKVAKNQGFTLLNTKDYFWTKMFRTISQILIKFKKSEEVVRNRTRCTWSPGISYIRVRGLGPRNGLLIPARVCSGSVSNTKFFLSFFLLLRAPKILKNPPTNHFGVPTNHFGVNKKINRKHPRIFDLVSF